jgi:hypothetical protein
VPTIKETIAGREYSFAPLLIGEMRRLNKSKNDTASLFDNIDTWKPFIEASMKRAGVTDNEMPDVEEMDLDTGSKIFTELVRSVMRACGIEVPAVGEVPPVAATGMPSTASS